MPLQGANSRAGRALRSWRVVRGARAAARGGFEALHLRGCAISTAGRSDFDTRVARLLYAYDIVFGAEAVARVDLRYTNGLALRPGVAAWTKT